MLLVMFEMVLIVLRIFLSINVAALKVAGSETHEEGKDTGIGNGEVSVKAKIAGGGAKLIKGFLPLLDFMIVGIAMILVAALIVGGLLLAMFGSAAALVSLNFFDAECITAEEKAKLEESSSSGSSTEIEINGKVFAVGDSLMEGSKTELKSSIQGIDQDSKVGRSMSEGVSIIEENDDITGTLVVGLATNAPVTKANLTSIRTAVGDDTVIVLVNGWGEDYDGKDLTEQISSSNDVIDEFIKDDDNAKLADWYSAVEADKKLLAADNLHQSSEGKKKYAELVTSAVGTPKKSETKADKKDDKSSLPVCKAKKADDSDKKEDKEEGKSSGGNGSVSAKIQTMIDSAKSQLGVSQDCTALVEKALQAAGIPAGDLGTQVHEYTALGGTHVGQGKALAQAGDVLVWPGQHVALYIGNDTIIHGGWTGFTTVKKSGEFAWSPSANPDVVRFS